jgi:hypothetical protein
MSRFMGDEDVPEGVAPEGDLDLSSIEGGDLFDSMLGELTGLDDRRIGDEVFTGGVQDDELSSEGLDEIEDPLNVDHLQGRESGDGIGVEFGYGTRPQGKTIGSLGPRGR